VSTARQAPDILSPEFASDPYPAYAVMREEQPLIWHEATQSYIISRYDDVERVFRVHDGQLRLAAGARPRQDDPPAQRREHAVRRALVAPAFRGNDLQEKFLPVIERNSRELIDAFRQSGSVDIVSDYATRFPGQRHRGHARTRQDRPRRFHRWYTAVIAFLGNLSGDPEVTAAGERTRVEFAEYMLLIIRERRDNLGDDLLSTLCAAEVDGVRMTDEDIKAFCSLLLAAGGETTDKAIASILVNLLLDPDQLAAVRADRGLIPAAFTETLRYTPPVHMIMRQAATEVEVSGGTIPKGATVTCLIGAANRDERRYREPDRFDIFRADLNTTSAFSAAADHLAFALGRHFCVGALLAKSEVEIGLNRLLDAMPDLRLADGFDPAEQGVFTRGPQSLPVRLTPVAG